jgi:D-inositol-3-phosphate glycosyltransferase
MNVYMRELAHELGQQNIHVDIFTRWTNESTPRIVQLHRNVRVIHIQAGPRASICKDDLYQYLPSFAQQIEEFRRSNAIYYDLLHSHYWLASVSGTRLAKWWDVPHITMFHTLARLKQLAHPNEPESQLRLETEQRLIQQVDRIIAATEEERMQMIRLCAASVRQVQVVPCGVDLKLFVPHRRQQAREKLGLQHPMLLFVGRLDPFKGADLLLQAAAMMEEAAEVVIVGGAFTGDSDLQKLRALAADLGISRRVHFLGARPQRQLPPLYSAADITVMPSYHESFGLVAVESLACGTPVVATRAGGLTTIVHHGETGYLVPRCPGFFAERLDTLLRDSDLRGHMQAAARRSVLQYSWRSVANRMHSVYKDVLSETRLAKAT